MKILFVSDVSIKNVIGGAERVLHEQATYLSRLGHDVHVITRKLPEHSSLHENIQNVQEWRYQVKNSNPFSFILSSIQNSQKIFKHITNDTHFDLINFHQPFSAFAINLLKHTDQMAKVYTCHSLSFEEYQTRHKKSFVWSPFLALNILFRKFIEKFSLRKSDKIIVLSQFTKDKLIKNYPISENVIEIIFGGVDTTRFKPTQDKQEIRAQLNFPRDQFILFSVRNFVPRMGLENLIQAMTILNKQDSQITLLIGGEGALKGKLQTLIKDSHLEKTVSLCGFISSDDLPGYYQMADYFILPTIALEGFGLVTVEAMACGTPVLGTPIGGTLEILHSFGHKSLFEDPSPESMAKLIWDRYTYYKNKPGEYKKLCQKCRTFIEENYTWERNVNKTETLFNQLTSTHPETPDGY